jgi:uncharacterized LabA/DUF88 family protein
MNRVVFLIDGFNIYHSVLDIQNDTGYCAKWLDLTALCKSYVYQFGRDARIEAIYYFSAIPEYLNSTNPGKIKRHKRYITCLKSKGIVVELGRFKEKKVFCDNCKKVILKHEEKETDVTIAIKVFEVFLKNECETVVIVSGDTDLAPAIRKCKILFPTRKVIFCFPYNRKNMELFTLAPGSFSINRGQYIKYQLPNPVILENGQKINKPSTW